MRRRASVARSVSALAGSAAGVSHMFGAASGDLARSVAPRRLVRGQPATDPLDLRDPEYIRRTLPTLRAMSRVYFRAEVRGLENIPAHGPVLLVGNHSGGTLIADTFVFAQAFYDHFGADREFHQLAHDLVFKVPGVRALLTPRTESVPASPENMRRALARNAALLVYPGGDRETYRATWHSADIDFAHRTGFVRLGVGTGRPDRPGGGDRRPGDGALPWSGGARRATAPPAPAAADRCRARPDRAALGRDPCSTSRAGCRCPRRSRSRCCRRSTSRPRSGPTPTPAQDTTSSPGECRKHSTSLRGPRVPADRLSRHASR